MNIEEYFDFLAADGIRIKGTRIGIETVVKRVLFFKREEIKAKSKPGKR